MYITTPAERYILLNTQICHPSGASLKNGIFYTYIVPLRLKFNLEFYKKRPKVKTLSLCSFEPLFLKNLVDAIQHFSDFI